MGGITPPTGQGDTCPTMVTGEGEPLRPDGHRNPRQPAGCKPPARRPQPPFQCGDSLPPSYGGKWLGHVRRKGEGHPSRSGVAIDAGKAIGQPREFAQVVGEGKAVVDQRPICLGGVGHLLVGVPLVRERDLQRVESGEERVVGVHGWDLVKGGVWELTDVRGSWYGQRRNCWGSLSPFPRHTRARRAKPQ